MTDLDQFTRLPPDFDGRVRLFPLPELVVFPNAMQPLHIFEPRYCEMLEDALAGDSLIAMATLAPGWQQPLSGDARIEEHVCICRVISHATTEDDRHNVLVVGLRRARVLEEEETNRSFRTARVEVLEDVYPIAGSARRSRLKRRLLDAFRLLIPDVAEVQKNLHELMASQMRLGAVTDIIGFTMQFDRDSKVMLLGQSDVDQRAESLIRILRERALVTVGEPSGIGSSEATFPPPFSDN